ncbi:inhibin beta E chain [Anolis carolinensis]|uniref:Inhibin subunit beta C n=1 Tax=Anolis carolinensis TaxID=28377 RepID=A0A803T6C6_ANOCA|nr:PREDICTED: inhibin beta E chain [Anolis carolinensis]|eukprot:XP_003223677.1 PREDICTED: inhibin beta E chain [Anolis carolinensis]
MAPTPPYNIQGKRTLLATVVLLWTFVACVEGRPGCPSCRMPPLEPSAEKAFLVEVAKQQILQKLNLSQRPNITHPVPRAVVANALRRLHLGKGRMDGPGLSSRWEKPEPDEQGYEIISFAETEPSGLLQFQLTQTKGQDMHILQAHLWLYLKVHRNITLQVYLAGHERVALAEQQLGSKGSSWHTFSLMPGMQNFFQHKEKALQLELQCKGCHPNITALVTTTGSSHQPFLVVKAKVREPSHQITKRSLSCDQNSAVCCRKDYYVDFRDIGWNDWIFKPEGYQINYCMGECPMHLAGTPGIAASFHTTVFNLVKANNIQTAGRSCCVPTQRRALSLLYFDPNSNLIKTDIPDMVVDACGCS